MQPARIPDHNAVLSAPQNWDAEAHGHCGKLYIRQENINGVGFMRSAWDVEALEALQLAVGSRLVLGISGPTHPVVNLDIGPLPEDFEPVVMCRSIVHQGRPSVRVDGFYPAKPVPMNYWALVELGDMTFAQAAQKGIDAVEHLAAEERAASKEG